MLRTSVKMPETISHLVSAVKTGMVYGLSFLRHGAIEARQMPPRLHEMTDGLTVTTVCQHRRDTQLTTEPVC